MSPPPSKCPRLDTSGDLFSDESLSKVEDCLVTSTSSPTPLSNFPRPNNLNETYDLFEYQCAPQRARPSGPVTFARAIERVTYDPDGRTCDFNRQPRMHIGIIEYNDDYNPELNRAFCESDDSVISLH